MFLPLLGLLLAQSTIGDWVSFTATLEINRAVYTNGDIACATPGGILVFHEADNEFTTITNVDGLVNTNLSTIALDSSGIIWVGGASPEGTLQRYDMAHKQALESWDFSLSEILAITTTDSAVFVAYKQSQELGIMEFRRDETGYFYRDFYQNFPLTFTTILGLGFSRNKIYLATDSGLLAAGREHTNLKNPQSWEQPFPNLAIIQVFNASRQEIVLQSEQKIYRITEEDSLILWHDYFRYNLSTIAHSSSGTVWGTLSTKLLTFGSSGIDQEFIIPRYSALSLTLAPDGSPILGTKQGLGLIRDNRLRYFKANGIVTNNLTAVRVLQDGRIVAASSKGISIRESEGWRNIVETMSDTIMIHSERDYNYFVADTVPIDFGNYIFDIQEAPTGKIFFSVRGTYPEPVRHGGGVIIMDIDNPYDYTLLDTAYFDWFVGSNNTTPYLVVHEMTWDRTGNLWVADAFATVNHNPLTILTPNLSPYAISANEFRNLSLTPTTIAIDGWNRAWVGAFSDDHNIGYGNGGLVMVTVDGNFPQPDAINVSTQSIRAFDPDIDDNPNIWDMVINSQDRLFAVTPLGLEIVDLQSSESNPIREYGSFRYFPNISFTKGSKIALDAYENVWVTSPHDGIHVLLSNAAFWPDNDPNLDIEAINTSSSGLLSDQVTNIDFDDRLGYAVITSNKGLNLFRIPFSEGKQDYSRLKVYPSPFVLNRNDYLVIADLTKGSSAQIMTLTGQVIRKLTNADLGIHGDQILWDGKDNAGRTVNSGVYLISIYDGNNRQSFTKITVIR
ncbi:MAG: T9SS type A sorting domain-containing protein [Fidelibacterota bacterium]